MLADLGVAPPLGRRRGPLVEQSLRTIQRGSKSFALAARLFDAPTREGAILLYAWCRHWNDQIDGLWARPRG